MIETIVVSGSRQMPVDRAFVIAEELKLYPNAYIIEGGAIGVDQLARLERIKLGMKGHTVLPEYKYWIQKIGKVGAKVAPLKRNELMLDGKLTQEGRVIEDYIPDLLLAFHFLSKDDDSGTTATVRGAIKRRILFKEFIIS